MPEFVLTLGEWLQANPQLSGLVYVAAFALIMAVGVPGGNALMLSGGFLFGWWAGTLLTTVGGVLAAGLTHALVRTALGRWLEHRAAVFRDATRSFVAGGNALLLVVPRLIPLIPFFAINASLTAAGVPLRTYLWTTAVGLFPVALLICRVGSEFRDMNAIDRASIQALLLSPGLYLPLLLLIGLTVGGWWLIRRRVSA